MRRSSCFAVCAIAASIGCRAPGPPQASAQNLVLIVVDTLRRDHLPFYGYGRDTAPVLGKLAAEGAVFDGLSTTSWTRPAVASILTGLHPVRHRTLLDDALPDAATTLAERLGAQGYMTLGISSNAHISSAFGFEQGFDELVPLMQDFESGPSPSPADVNRALSDRLDALRPPYFLYLHYLDPHAPYDPETAWDGSPLDERLGSVAPIRGVDLRQRLFVERSPQLVRDAIDLYDGEIRGVDRAIGEALSGLRERGLLESTLTVVTADHGEEFEEHGRMGHGKTLYAETVQVPLLFHAPGVVRAGLRGGFASVMDIVPTAGELLGLEIDEWEVDGRSLADVTLGVEREQVPRALLLNLDLREVGALGWLAMQRGDDKLLLARYPYAKQLFLGDPLELETQIGAPEAARALTELSEAAAARFNQLSSEALDRATAAPSEDVRAALAALGYAGAASDHSAVLADLPHGIRPADPEADGLLGWEPTLDEARCVATAAPEAIHQLLAGWQGVEHGGRWSEPVATLALARPPGDLELRLDGINPLDRPVRARLAAGGTPVDVTLEPGHFRVSTPIETGDGSPVLVRVERLPPLVPARVAGGRKGLGLFLTKLCLSSEDR